MELPIRVQLCNGLQAWVLWNSGEGDKPLIGCYYTPDWGWIPASWTEDGHYQISKEAQKSDCNLDLEWVKKEPLVA